MTLARREKLLVTLAGCVLLLLAASICLAQEVDYDIIIRGGRIVDGTGNPWYPADVAIKDGRIAAVGRLEGKNAGSVLDAAGLYVTPGFIDTHTHSDRGLSREDLVHLARNSIEAAFLPDADKAVLIRELDAIAAE